MKRILMLALIFLTLKIAAAEEIERDFSEVLDAPEVKPLTLEKPATPEQLQPLFEKFKTACLKYRGAFAAKYVAVHEDPQATCACVQKAIEAQRSVSVTEAGIKRYTQPGPATQAADATEDYVDRAESNCRVDPKWVTGTLQPPHFFERFQDILKRMTYLHKSAGSP